MKHLHIIAIAVSLVIVLGGASAVMMGHGEDPVGTIKSLQDTIESRGNDQPPYVPTQPTLRTDITAVHTVTAARNFTPWSLERAPASVTLERVAVIEPPVHAAPRITLIEPKQDSEKKRAVFIIHVQVGQVARAEIESLVVEALPSDAPEGTAWIPVATLAPVAGGALIPVTVDDQARLPAEKEYKFRATTTAKATVESKEPFQARAVSAETPPVLLPPDQIWAVTSITEGKIDPATSNFKPGRLTVARHYWDYDAKKIETKRDTYLEPDPSKWQDGPPVCGTNYRLKWIKPADAKKQTPVYAELGDPSNKSPTGTKILTAKRPNERELPKEALDPKPVPIPDAEADKAKTAAPESAEPPESKKDEPPAPKGTGFGD